ncbi:hypothetical protein JOD44_002517 [Salimicrobium jeotgali]|nr:hypothetical protein [Salimicrobium jeotgali]
MVEGDVIHNLILGKDKRMTSSVAKISLLVTASDYETIVQLI